MTYTPQFEESKVEHGERSMNGLSHVIVTFPRPNKLESLRTATAATPLRALYVMRKHVLMLRIYVDRMKEVAFAMAWKIGVRTCIPQSDPKRTSDGRDRVLIRAEMENPGVFSEHEHDENCRYIGFGLWDCGHADQH